MGFARRALEAYAGRIWPDLAGSGRIPPDLAGSRRIWPDPAGAGRIWLDHSARTRVYTPDGSLLAARGVREEEEQLELVDAVEGVVEGVYLAA